MKPPFRLVPDDIPEDVPSCLKVLNEQAQRKEIIGLGFFVMYKDRDVIVNGAGEAIRSPMFARGVVKSLDDFFRSLI